MKINRGFSVQTQSGSVFDPESGEIDHIGIDDIAHALSHTCRYSGHCRKFYSVAEHSVLVSRIVANMWPDDLEARWAALLHDATEAYVGDVTTPLKVLLPDYEEIEDRLAEKIGKEFDIKWNKRVKNRVRTADVIALATEAPRLFNDVSHWTAIKLYVPMNKLLDKKFPLGPGKAKDKFLAEFNKLKKRIEK